MSLQVFYIVCSYRNMKIMGLLCLVNARSGNYNWYTFLKYMVLIATSLKNIIS